MRVAIDARPLSWPGIGRYICELTSHLLRLESPCEFHIFINREEQAQFFAGEGRTPGFTIVRSRVHSLAEQVELPWHLHNKRIDLFHAPSSLVAPLWTPCPMVLTVHDLLFKAHPEFTGSLVAKGYFNIVHDRAVSRAARIITVSDFTRKELGRFHPHAGTKARTIHNGIAASFYRQPCCAKPSEFNRAAGIDAPYFLAVGSLKRHKNFVTLLRAFATLKARCPGPVQLVIIAKRDLRNPDESIACLVGELGLADHVLFIDNLSEEQLAAAYTGAEAFVSTSLYEGFGLPIAEAMACRVPIIVSDIEVFREITSGHALYANPASVEAVADAMQRVLDNRSNCQSLVNEAYKHSRSYCWDTVAQRTMAVYAEAMGA